MKAWQAAVAVLKETDNPAIMWGDSGLAHAIADKLGWEHEGPWTHDRVIAALRRSPGELQKSKTFICGRWVCIFHLPN